MSVRVITVGLEELRQLIREELAAVQPLTVATPPSPPVLTTDEAAARAKRSPETIRDWIKTGRLRTLPRSGRQHHRIRAEDLDRALLAPNSIEMDDGEWARSRLAKRRIG